MSGPWVYSQIDDIIKQFFTVTSIAYRPMSDPNSPLQSDMVPIYEILRRTDLAGNIKQANLSLSELGYMSLIRPHPIHESRGVLYIFPMPEKMKVPKQNVRTPLVLFGLTILSVFFVGLIMWEELREIRPSLNPIVIAVSYVIGLMGIVGIHELGHMVASRLHGLKSSWPYFIPMPIGMGTMGAFITLKTPFRSRNNLFDVGLAGPIFGFVASIFFTIIGLLDSIVVPISEIPLELTNTSSFLDFEIPLFQILVRMLIPAPSIDSMIFLHPFAFAGFIGLFITGLNMIPIGQSDGGHVARSLFSEKQHRYVTYISAGLLIILGFWFFAILLIYMYSQTGHSGPLDDLTEVSLSRKIVAAFALILLVLCLPIPSDIFAELFPSL